MKIFFFLLTLVNVALFMWEYHQGAFSIATETFVDNAVDYQEPILLVSELTDNTSIARQTDKVPALADNHPVDTSVKNEIDERPEKTEFITDALNGIKTSVPETLTLEASPATLEKMATGPVEKQPINCFEVGPFTNEQIYQDWAQRLNGFIREFNRDEPEIKDYLVYYPASETMILSQANLKMLKDKGVSDLWIFTQGTEQGQISLGVFTREEKALIMKKELLAKGINAEIKARYKTNVQKFGVIRAESNVVSDNLQLLKKAYPKLIVKQTGDSATENCF